MDDSLKIQHLKERLSEMDADYNFLRGLLLHHNQIHYVDADNPLWKLAKLYSNGCNSTYHLISMEKDEDARDQKLTKQHSSGTRRKR